MPLDSVQNTNVSKVPVSKQLTYTGDNEQILINEIPSAIPPPDKPQKGNWLKNVLTGLGIALGIGTILAYGFGRRANLEQLGKVLKGRNYLGIDPNSKEYLMEFRLFYGGKKERQLNQDAIPVHLVAYCQGLNPQSPNHNYHKKINKEQSKLEKTFESNNRFCVVFSKNAPEGKIKFKPLTNLWYHTRRGLYEMRNGLTSESNKNSQTTDTQDSFSLDNKMTQEKTKAFMRNAENN